jgi:hypothetical protein
MWKLCCLRIRSVEQSYEPDPFPFLLLQAQPRAVGNPTASPGPLRVCLALRDRPFAVANCARVIPPDRATLRNTSDRPNPRVPPAPASWERMPIVRNYQFS